MSVFRETVGREMVGFAGSPTGRDCCIAVIDDVHRAATFALGVPRAHRVPEKRPALDHPDTSKRERGVTWLVCSFESIVPRVST